MVKNEHFDMMILDFIMTPIHGDKVIEEIRKFNKNLYILLLTGHKDLAPPLETIRRYDIQGYCEKTDKFDQLLLLIESGIKSIAQMRTIQKINEELTESNKKFKNELSIKIKVVNKNKKSKNNVRKGCISKIVFANLKYLKA